MTEFNKSVLDFDIKASTTLIALNILLHVAALAGITLLTIPWYGQGACMFAVIASFIVTLNRFILLRTANAVVGVRYREPLWQLKLVSGESINVTLTGEVVVTNFLIIISFTSSDNQRYAVPLFVDSVNVDQHRLGRVFFRMRGFEV